MPDDPWEILASRPLDIDTCRRHVCTLQASGDFDEATAAWLALANALFYHGDYRQAVLAYGQVLACRPRCVPALKGISMTHLAVGEVDPAVRYLTTAITSAPDHAELHGLLGYAYQLLGDADRGWDAFASSHRFRGRRYDHEQPLWDGRPLHGRRILLWCEQGLGDTIQFLRYIGFVKERGGRIAVECHHSGLIPLIRRMPGVERVIPAGAPLPPFDVHAPLMHFPGLFHESRAWVDGRVPYLSADDHTRAAWRERLGDSTALRVGISWAGNENHPGARTRFVSLELFRALARVEGVRLISLQHGDRGNDVTRVSGDFAVERLFEDPFPITDAAALIENLDLVISVDTMIAHLAGALSRPVWTLLRYAANWRWRLNGERTTWYPTMRLFRQERFGEWNGVFERVRNTLIEMRDERTASSRVIAS